jgi:hypothetical protein
MRSGKLHVVADALAEKNALEALRLLVDSRKQGRSHSSVVMIFAPLDNTSRIMCAIFQPKVHLTTSRTAL